MSRLFSRRWGEAGGRRLGVLETEGLRACALEMDYRLSLAARVAQPSAQSESLSSLGGLLSQAIREGTAEPFHQYLLAECLSPSDASRLQTLLLEFQATSLATIAVTDRPLVEAVLNPVIAHIQQVQYAAVLKREQAQIANLALESLKKPGHGFPRQLNAQAQAKCKRDITYVVDEFARSLHSAGPTEAQRRLATWLVLNLISQVNYPATLWAGLLREVATAISAVLGAEAARVCEPILTALAERAAILVEVGQLCNSSAKLAASLAAEFPHAEPRSLNEAIHVTLEHAALAILENEDGSRLVQVLIEAVLPNCSVWPETLTQRLGEVPRVGRLIRSTLQQIARAERLAVRLPIVSPRLRCELLLAYAEGAPFGCDRLRKWLAAFGPIWGVGPNELRAICQAAESASEQDDKPAWSEFAAGLILDAT